MNWHMSAWLILKLHKENKASCQKRYDSIQLKLTNHKRMLSWVYGFIHIKAEANIWQNLVEDTLF